MKLHLKKNTHKIRNRFLLGLAAVAAGFILPALSVSAAGYEVTNETTQRYASYMKEEGLDSDEFEEVTKRVTATVEFLRTEMPELTFNIPSKLKTDKNDAKWSPSQSDIDKNRDLYLIEWVNGTKKNPGSGYEIKGSIVYLDTNNNVRYTNEAQIDRHARDYTDLSYGNQFDYGRINQALVALPDDCAQILGILMYNESGGGDNNNAWNMQNLYITRIKDDDLDNISGLKTNSDGFKYRSYEGTLVGSVSPYDVQSAWLGTDDRSEEWLYLLQTPTETNVNFGDLGNTNYYVQFITENSDFSNETITLTVEYLDYFDNPVTYTTTINNDTVSKFYPTVQRIDGYYEASIWESERTSVSTESFKQYSIKYQSMDWGYTYATKYYNTYVNSIAYEKTNGEDKLLAEQVNSFTDYHWDTATTSETNLHAALYFGNFIDYDMMKADLFGPYSSTDVPLALPSHIKEVTGIKVQKSGTDTKILQDVRILKVDGELDSKETRMNGGLSTERIYDYEGICMSSVSAPAGIVLVSDAPIYCCLDPQPYTKELPVNQHSTDRILSFDTSDMLGIQIDFADVYGAGIEEFASRYTKAFLDLNVTTEFHYEKYVGEEKEFYELNDQITSTSQMKDLMLEQSVNYHKFLDPATAFELLSVMEAYTKECLTIRITYLDTYGARRVVEVPFITAYMLQLYSDNGMSMGTTTKGSYDMLMGVLQQGQSAALRVPLSQYRELVDIRVSFGSSPSDLANIKNNKVFFEGVYDHDELRKDEDEEWILEEWIPTFWNDYDKVGLEENETILGGKLLPTSDTISLQAIRIYEGASEENFRNKYHYDQRIARAETTLAASYHFTSNDNEGYRMAFGTALPLSVADESLSKGDIDYALYDLSNTYLIELSGQFLEEDNNADLFVSLGYTTHSGEEVRLDSKRLSEWGRNFYGFQGNNETLNSIFPHGTAQVAMGMRDKCYFTIELENVARFDYISLSLPDGMTGSWQINNVRVVQLTELDQRTVTEEGQFQRVFNGKNVAFSDKAYALQSGKEGKTIYFSHYNSDGSITSPDGENVVTNDYLVTTPTKLTYEETLKNLGLAVTKYEYTVDVEVANVMDAGSTNHFYFQLVFENGTSGVVLANQQLAADGFRQGYTETFTIKTTQNYGNVTSVRVICDTSSSTSNAFDKLNINKISVTLNSKGTSKSWIVDKVGWIDINFQDEGVSTNLSASEESKGFSNSQVIKEFPRTRIATSARLLFNIATSADSVASMSSDPGEFEAVLTYEDSNGDLKTYSFDLLSKIYEFNENESSYYLFKPNKSNYFTLTVNDIRTVKSLSIYRSGNEKSSDHDWLVSNVILEQVVSYGDVYLNTNGEFRRYMPDNIQLAESSNRDQLLSSTGNATFIFPDHSITADVSDNNPANWTTVISRIPLTAEETFNVYLYAGTSGNHTYQFTEDDLMTIKGSLDYNLKSGTGSGRKAFIFDQLGVIGGTTVLTATGITVSDINSLQKLYLQNTAAEAPVIKGAKVERIRGNTIMEILYFDFNNKVLTQNTQHTAVAKADTTSSQTTQTVLLQLAAGQSTVLTPSTNDIAIALRYTSENDSGETKMVYTSPYVFLTDVGIMALNKQSLLEIPFQITGVDEVLGLSVVSSGPSIVFENSLIINQVKNADGSLTLVDTCHIAQGFRTSTIEQQFLRQENSNVTPVTITLHTSSAEEYTGAGTSGIIPATLFYTNTDGSTETVEFENIVQQLPNNTLPTAGSSVSFTILLSNLNSLDSMTLTANNDNWHLHKVTAELSQYRGATSTAIHRTAMVDAWVTSSESAHAIFGNGNDAEQTANKLINLNITAQASHAGTSKTASSGQTLELQVYPGDKVFLTPTLTVEGTPDTTIIWNKALYDSYMSDGTDGILVFHVPNTIDGNSSVGQIFTFDGYCQADNALRVTVSLQVIEPATDEENDSSDDIPEETQPDETEAQEASVNLTILDETNTIILDKEYDAKDHEDVITVTAAAGSTYTLQAIGAPEGTDVTLSASTITVTADTSVTLTCTDAQGSSFTLTILFTLATP